MKSEEEQEVEVKQRSGGITSMMTTQWIIGVEVEGAAEGQYTRLKLLVDANSFTDSSVRVFGSIGLR